MANRAHSSPGHTRRFEWILHVTAEFHREEPDWLGSSKIGFGKIKKWRRIMLVKGMYGMLRSIL